MNTLATVASVLHSASLNCVFWKAETYDALGPEAYPRPWLERWMKEVVEPDYVAAASLDGSHLYVSLDSGVSWTRKGWGPDSIHGGVTLQDGTLMVCSYREERDAARIYRSADSGDSWDLLTTIHAPNPDGYRFGEPHVAQMPSGRIVVMIRSASL